LENQELVERIANQQEENEGEEDFEAQEI